MKGYMTYFFEQHKRLILGYSIVLVIALIFAVSVISYGFFKTLFLFVCIALGVWGGLLIDKRAKENKGKDSAGNE